MFSVKKSFYFIIIPFLVLSFFTAMPLMANSQISASEQKIMSNQRGTDITINNNLAISKSDIKKGYVEGEVLVKFKENKIDLNNPLSDKKIHAFYKDKALRGETIIQEGNLTLLKSDNKTTEKIIGELRKDPAVEYVEPNYIYHIASIPNDTDFNKQWGLHNTGQMVNGITGTNDVDIDMPEAWDFLSGKNTSEVKVAVLDTGVDLDHLDLSSQIVEGYDFVDNDSEPQDLNGHGTHVAGIIGALGNNSQGIAGFSSKIKIVPIRVFDADGYGTLSDIVLGIHETYDRGAKIVNMSFGGPDYSQSMYDAMSFGTSLYDTLFVAASGNGGTDRIGDNNDTDPIYPASYDLDNIISVAATDQNDNLVEFSNYGATTVDVAAPGVNIYSTYLFDSNPLFSEDFEDVTPPDIGTNFSQSGDGTWGTYHFTIPDNNVIYGDLVYPYQNNIDSYLTSSIINTSVSGKHYLHFNYGCQTEFIAFDYVSVQVNDGSSGWNELEKIWGDGVYGSKVYDVTSFNSTNFQFRFLWYTDFIIGYDGCWLDDIRIENGSGYTYMNGTSMAAPFVSGLAAVIKSINTNYTYEGIKNVIINNVDQKSALNGKVLSRGRINANNTLLDTKAPTATITYLTTKPTNKNVVATLVPSKFVTITNNGGADKYTFTENGSFTFKFVDIVGNTGSATATVTNIDKVAPTATITYSTTDSTNQDVIATLVPSETVTITNNNGNDSHTFTENGSFTFEFKDAAGNTGSATATVNNIDKVVPTSTISYSTTELTNQDVIVTLVFSEIVTVTNNNGSATYTFTKNGSFTFDFTDASGNSGDATATINNIDKTAPQDPIEYFIYSDNTKKKSLNSGIINFYPNPYFEWSGASDSNGIKGYYVKFSTDINTNATNGSFQVENYFTSSKLITDDTYYLHVKTVDNVGNISTGVYLSYIFIVPKVLGEEVGAPFIVAGTKAGGGPEVRIFNTEGKLLKSFNAYDDTFWGGINVAVGDIDGNGTREIITSTREGGIPTIKVFDVEGNNLGWDFEAYDSAFRGGINIGVGDIEGDGPSEIAVAPMSGGSPHVRIFGLRDGKIVPTTESFMAYNVNFRGGIAISIGDIENDGIGDIITTPTSRGGPHIRIFGVRNRRYVPVTLGVMAYAESFRGGINSCVGDVNNDGKDEIMTGIVSAGGPHVRIFGVGRNKRMELSSPGFMAYDPAHRGGVSVTSIDINYDGYSEIITGVGGDGNSVVRIFDRTGKQVANEFMAYSENYKGGITLASGYF